MIIMVTKNAFDAVSSNTLYVSTTINDITGDPTVFDERKKV